MSEMKPGDMVRTETKLFANAMTLIRVGVVTKILKGLPNIHDHRVEVMIEGELMWFLPDRVELIQGDEKRASYLAKSACTPRHHKV